jgi:adenylate cyclase
VSEEGVERKLTTILAADVVGYSRLMGEDEAGTLARLKTLRKELVQPKITGGRGRIVKLMGDGLLAEFPSVVEAVRCAVDIQQDMGAREPGLPGDRRIRLRIGVNLGDIIVEGSDIYGDGVNVAARLEGLAEPGGICISGKVYEEVRNKLSTVFEDLGEREVKNIREPVRVYRWTETAADPSPGMTGAERPPPLPDKPSIAVLPFDNMSGDPEQEFFADGLVEDIITTLSKLAGLTVIARSSSFAYKGRAIDVRQAARELRVRYVLEGSVRRGGDRIRVNVQLIDATTGGHLWASRFDRLVDDIFAVQDEITLNVATELQVHLTEGEQSRLRYTTTSNVDAWEYWIQGQAFQRCHVTSDGVGRAREFWEKALELDPGSAALHASLGMVYFGAARYQWWGERDSELARAEAYAATALSIDPGNGDAHLVKALVMLMRGQHEEAVILAQRAIDLAPGSADIASFGAMVFNYSGRPAEGLLQIERAFQLCPVYPAYYLSDIGLANRLLGHHEDAIRAFQEYSRRSPGFGYADLAIIYETLGRHDEARAEAVRLKDTRPGFSIGEWSRTQFFKNPAQLEADIAALRAAGLPE